VRSAWQADNEEIAPQVNAVFERYGLTYTSSPLIRQVASAWHKVIRLSLPNDFPRLLAVWSFHS
jgi:hypothetical protein